MIYGDLLRALTKVGANLGALEKEMVFQAEDGTYYEPILVRDMLTLEETTPIVIAMKTADKRVTDQLPPRAAAKRRRRKAR